MGHLEIINLTKRFNHHAVLNNFSLSARKGELLGLLGPSGSGKTTLLRIIAGLEEPDEGLVYLGSQLVNDPHRIVPPKRRAVGMVFQDLALWPHLMAWQHLSFVLGNRPEIRSGKLEIQDEIKKVCGMVNFPREFLAKYPHQLSGGEKQRLAIARVLAQAPRILLLDEPLSNLDFSLKEKIRRQIGLIQRKLSITTLYVTHDLRELSGLADRTIHMVQ